MGKVRLGDYCCQAGDKVVDQMAFTESDLLIAQEGKRELIFSPLGNQPRAPKLALVGITPGAQSKEFQRLLKFNSVEIAAKKSAFAGAHKAIRTLITAHGFLDALGINCPSDVNDSDEILTTSLVKCCLRVNGSYQYAAPDIAASKAASKCVAQRFIRDMEAYDTIRHVVIFGDPGWEAINSLTYQGTTVKRHLESRGITVLNLPHFARNYQQRAIYALKPAEDEAYFRIKPKNRPYWSNAAKMRERMINEVNRLLQRSG